MAVARAVQEQVQNSAVIVLFGSRARGDYSGHSDIDLMMLVPDREANCRDAWAAVSRTARAAAEREYGCPMTVDVLQINHQRFRRGRRAVNHVAYDVTRDGIPMTQMPFEAVGPDADDDGYPDNWPDISERLKDALDSFRHMRYDLADGSEKYLGRNALETLEHCYKALISALGVSYPRTHNLRELEALLDQISERHGLNIPPCHDWLVDFYGGKCYDPPGPIPIEPQAFFEQVEQVKDAIIARVHEITGTSASDLYPGS